MLSDKYRGFQIKDEYTFLEIDNPLSNKKIIKKKILNHATAMMKKTLFSREQISKDDIQHNYEVIYFNVSHIIDLLNVFIEGNFPVKVPVFKTRLLTTMTKHIWDKLSKAKFIKSSLLYLSYLIIIVRGQKIH